MKSQTFLCIVGAGLVSIFFFSLSSFSNRAQAPDNIFLLLLYFPKGENRHFLTPGRVKMIVQVRLHQSLYMASFFLRWRE